MAETYLSSLLRPLSKRRTRALGSIDPMESAAAMDRMQGAVVSGTAQMEPADAGSNILQAVGGGGGVPVRTAQMTEGDEAPIRQAGFTRRGGPVGGCPGGQCGRPMMQSPYSFAPSAPIQTTTTVTPAASGTASTAPTTTTVAPANLGERAIDLAGSYYTAPQAAAALRVYGTEKAADAERDKTLLARDRFNQEVANYKAEEPVRKAAALAAIEDVKSTTALQNAEAKNSEAQADLVAGSTIPGSMDQRQDALQRVTTGESSVEDYVLTLLRADATLPVVTQADGKSKVTKLESAAPDMSAEGRVRAYRRAGYAALGINVMFSSEQVALANRGQTFTGPAPMTTAALNYNRQAPLALLDDAVSVGQPLDPVAVASDAADIIVNNYASSESFKLPREQLTLLLEDDLRRPMVRTNIARHTAGIDRERDPAGYRMKEAAATEDANKYFNLIRAKVMQAYNAANAPAGQGTARPKMTRAQYDGLKDTIDSNDTLPSTPGAAPPGGYPIYGSRIE